MKNLKKIVVAALVSIFTITISGCDMIEKTPEAIQNSVVATIGDEKITRGQLDSNPVLVEQITKLKQQYGENYAKNEEVKEQFVAYKKQILDQMTIENILLKKAKELKIDKAKVEEELNKNLDSIVKQNFGGDKNKFLEQIKGSGVDEKSLKDFYRTQITIEKVREAITKDVKVDDAKALKYYNDRKYSFTEKPSKFHSLHILVKTEEEAKKARERVTTKGEDFKKVAKEISIDPSAKQNSGDLGSVQYGEFVKPFVDAVVNMKKGEISQPVKSTNGYHIIKLIDKEPFTIKKFDTVKAQIKNDLLKQEQDKAFNDKITEFKKDAKVETKKYEKNIL